MLSYNLCILTISATKSFECQACTIYQKNLLKTRVRFGPTGPNKMSSFLLCIYFLFSNKLYLTSSIELCILFYIFLVDKSNG